MTICVSEQPLKERLKRNPYQFGFASPLNEPALEHVVDSAIYPLVQAFNSIEGVATLASCSGHYGIFGYGYSPYVFFLSPVPFAERFASLLRAMPQSGFFTWDFEISFHPKLGLAFTLRGHHTWLRSIPIRKKDIDQLVELLHQAASS
jgi:hypothetical protein